MLHQPQHHGRAVLDIDEVAQLGAVGIALLVRLEQADGFSTCDQLGILGHQAAHVALVVFVRSVDVEELHAGPLRRAVAFYRTLHGPFVELMLGPAVQVERRQLVQCIGALVIIEALATVAVGGGRRSVDQRRTGAGAPVPPEHGCMQVDAQDLVAIGRGGGRIGPHVEHRVGLGRQALQQGIEIAVIDQVQEASLGNILPLALSTQVVDQQQVGAATRVEVCNNIGTDEARRSGNYYHLLNSFENYIDKFAD